MDDFLLADLAWNTMESQLSSVETQTCTELQSVSNFWKRSPHGELIHGSLLDLEDAEGGQQY